MKFILTCLPIFNHVFTPPVSLAYLKAYVEHYTNVEVKILDLEQSYFLSPAINKNTALYWDKIWFRDHELKEKEKTIFDEFVKQIISMNPDTVGFSVAHSNIQATRYVASKIKTINPDIYIIYGGRYFCLREPWRYWIAQWHKNLPEANCIVKNEGEETLIEILKTLKKNTTPIFCKGTTIRLKDQIIDGGNRELIKDIDSIPFPDFSDFSKVNYLSDYIRMIFSRGCIGRCAYCVENDTMGTIRYRSPDNILKEIKLRLSQGYRKFQLSDLALNYNIHSLLEVCKKIIEEKLDIEFVFSEFRNSPQLNKDVFELLHKAGFRTICFGTESGSQFILDKMDKGIKIETIESNFKDAHLAGLKVILYLMVGFPGETEETFMETIGMLNRNKDFIDGITAIAPTEICSGSRIHDKLEAYNLNTTTLFNYPDVWESINGNNSLHWRRTLAARMHNYLREFKIPLVDFSVDGNPRTPLLKSQILNSKKIQEYKENTSLKNKNSDKSELRLNYAAELKIHEKHIDNTTNKTILFVITVKNTGTKEWRQGDVNWIRVGCKIYDMLKNDKLPLTELRQELPMNIENGGEFQVVFRIIPGLLPKGEYRISFDIVNECQFWFEDLGSLPLVEYVTL